MREARKLSVQRTLRQQGIIPGAVRRRCGNVYVSRAFLALLQLVLAVVWPWEQSSMMKSSACVWAPWDVREVANRCPFLLLSPASHHVGKQR